MHPYPQREKRFESIKMPFLLKAQTNDPEEVKFYSEQRRHYFNSLADIMISHYSNASDMADLGEGVDTWVLSYHLLNSFDYNYTSMDKLATLTSLLQTCLVEEYQHMFETLLVKQIFISKVRGKLMGQEFDENEDVIENLQKYR